MHTYTHSLPWQAFLEDSNGQNKGTTGQVRMNTPPSAVTVDTLENRIKHELIALGLFNIEDVRIKRVLFFMRLSCINFIVIHL